MMLKIQEAAKIMEKAKRSGFGPVCGSCPPLRNDGPGPANEKTGKFVAPGGHFDGDRRSRQTGIGAAPGAARVESKGRIVSREDFLEFAQIEPGTPEQARRVDGGAGRAAFFVQTRSDGLEAA